MVTNSSAYPLSFDENTLSMTTKWKVFELLNRGQTVKRLNDFGDKIGYYEGYTPWDEY